MAADIARGFHDQLMAQERERVALRIANGTKASSPQIVSHRRQTPEYTGANGGAVGSFNRPFFANKDESEKQLTGGVLRNFQYAQRVLGQRAKDVLEQQAAAEGIPEAARPGGEPPILDERESRELELNQLLSALQDEIESGNVSSIAFTDVKQIPRLLIALVPGFSGEEMARLRRFVGDMVIDMNVEAERAQADGLAQPEAQAAAAAANPEGLAQPQAAVRTNATRLNAFLRNVYDFISISEDDVGSDPKTRVARAKAVGKELFNPKKIFVKQAKYRTLQAPGGRIFRAFVEATVPSVPVRQVRGVEQIREGRQTVRLPNVPGTAREIGAKPQAAAIINRVPQAEVERYAVELGVDLEGLNQAEAREAVKRRIKQTPVRQIRMLFNISQ